MYKIFLVESVITNYRWANVIVRYRTGEARCINFDWSYSVKTLDFTVNILGFTIHRMSDVSAENKAMKGNNRSSNDSTINWSSCDSTIEHECWHFIVIPFTRIVIAIIWIRFCTQECCSTCDTKDHIVFLIRSKI